jgi:hypothetical protein
VVERVLPSPKLTGGEKMAEVMAEVRRRRLAKEAGLSEY